MIAEFAHCLVEQHTRQVLMQGRRLVLVAACTLEDVAAIDFLTTEVAGLSGDTAKLLEFVVVGLELVIAHSPILDRHVGRYRACAVPFREMCPQLMVGRKISPRMTAPMVGSAADTIAWKERTHPTHGQCGFRWCVPEGQRLHLWILNQIE